MGILLCAPGINQEAARFLILSMNRLQRSFEYEFLPFDAGDRFLEPFCDAKRLDRQTVRGNVAEFLERFTGATSALSERYRLREAPPDYCVLISVATFTDNYYSMRQKGMSIMALGNWQRVMAPPSLLEFVQTLLVRESVAAISPSLRSSVHLGTKGCLCDFTPALNEVRYKVMVGFICSHCQAALESDGLSDIIPDVQLMLSKEWLGTPTDPETPAGILFHLGYDLFVTKGLRATPWEAMRSSVRQEGVKQVVSIAGALLIAALIVALGLK